MSAIVSFINKLLPRSVKDKLRSDYSKKHRNEIIESWKNAGRPAPPPHEIKQTIIEEYQKKSNYKILVETGTYLGDMVEAEKDNFQKIYSIELGEKLWKQAIKRFSKYNHIEILQGDSGKVLKNITTKLNEPAIFWLDGHYSEGITAKGDKECPIFEELESIFAYNNLKHILLIDDARNFVGKGDYPTVQELESFVKSKNPAYNVLVKDDVIRFEA